MNCKNKIDKKATGHRLYRLIEESKMTYAEIAEYLGLQSSRVNMSGFLEKNFHQLKIYIILLICFK